MCTEIDELNFDAISDYADWALQSGIWDGRLVSLEDKEQLQDEVAERILNLLLSKNPDSFEFQKMSAQLAAIGTDNPYLLEKDIHELHLTQDGIIVQSGFFSPIKNFWKEHKVEILIGVAAVAIVTAVVVVAVCTGGAAAGAAAAGGAGLGGLAGSPNKSPTPPRPGPIGPVNPGDPFERTVSGSPAPAEPPPVQTRFWHAPFHHRKTCPQPPPIKQEPAFNTPPAQQPFPNLDLYRFDSNRNPPNLPLFPEPSKPNPNIYEQFGLVDKPQPIPDGPYIGAIPDGYDPRRDAIPLEPTPEVPRESLLAKAVKSLHLNERSSSYKIEGEELSSCRIGFINGMDTDFEACLSHGYHLYDASGGLSIECVHDQTHGKAIDLAEIGLCAYQGISINAGKLMRENWDRFIEEKKDDPNAIYIQIGHSKALITIYNELEKAPKEVRDRIIVLSIAPAKIIPKHFCREVLQYASENDVVYLGELIHDGIAHPVNAALKGMVPALGHRDQLILLQPHEDARGPDHDFESPTFGPVFKRFFESIREKDYIGRDK